MGEAERVSMFIGLFRNDTPEQFSEQFVKQPARGGFRFPGIRGGRADWYTFCMGIWLQHDEASEARFHLLA